MFLHPHAKSTQKRSQAYRTVQRGNTLRTRELKHCSGTGARQGVAARAAGVAMLSAELF